MILGAGVYQLPLIKKSKELGYYTMVVSIPGNYPGFEYADEVIYEDTTNVDSVLKIAKKKGINGICTTGTDVAVVTLGKICDELGLNGISYEGARIACNKSLMKQVFMNGGVRTAPFISLSTSISNKELSETCDRFGYPVIFKAIDSSGSRGIVVVNSASDIASALDAVIKATHTDTFIIEKFLTGIEFGAQAFVQDNKISFVIPHGDFVFSGDTGVPIGHYAPYGSSEICDDVYEQLSKAVSCMKLNNCAINADFILCNDQVYVLEIGARCGATCLAELVSIYMGYDYYEKIIKVALGEKVDMSPKNERRVPNASRLLISDITGTIKSIKNTNTISDNIYEIRYDYSEGDNVRSFHTGPDRIGHVIVYASKLSDALDILDRVCDNIVIEVES